MNRDDLIGRIVAATNPPPLAVEVEGLGSVFVRVQTAFDAEQLRKKLEAAPKDDALYTSRVLTFVLCDSEGKLLFDIEDAEAVKTLAGLPQAKAQKLLEASNQANALGKG